MKMDFSQPLALYGGSFDPVHQGHLEVARAIRRALPAHQLVFVPAGLSPGKAPPVAPGKLRSSWLNLLAEREGFLVWDTELKRPGPSYTVETLAEAHRQGAKRENLLWVVGADAYNSLPRWKDPEKIRELARIAVLNRPGTPLALAQADDLLIPMAEYSASSSAIRAALGRNPSLVSNLPEEVKSDLERLTLSSQNPYARKD
jgi:nicotinate-nucleotide adenylyltransferase